MQLQRQSYRTVRPSVRRCTLCTQRRCALGTCAAGQKAGRQAIRRNSGHLGASQTILSQLSSPLERSWRHFLMGHRTMPERAHKTRRTLPFDWETPGARGDCSSVIKAVMMSRQVDSCGLRVLHTRQVTAPHVGQFKTSDPGPYSTIAPNLPAVRPMAWRMARCSTRSRQHIARSCPHASSTR
jgi:hypothetical protein